MNASSGQRVTPLRRSGAHSSKKKAGLGGDDRRRWELLKARWDRDKAMGHRLTHASMARRLKCTPSTISQLLNGGMKLNLVWMLHFAFEFDCLPQDVWGELWPYPYMTTAQPQVAKLSVAWTGLSPETKAKIQALIEQDRGR